MAKELKCKLCDKPATVHLTQIVNNQVSKIDLCEECAKQQGISEGDAFSLADMLMQPSAKQNDSKCNSCGLSLEDFKKRGLFGCPACYDTFKSLLQPMLRGMHEGVRHEGKIPELVLQRTTRQRRIDEMESALHEAIAGENFERAAELRDQIAALREELASVQDETVSPSFPAGAEADSFSPPKQT